MATVDIQKLYDHEYIKHAKHPTLDLIIWNYTSDCQFDKAWDEYTIMCRGLITNSKGTIIARPFPKFFNVGETPETQMYKLPQTIPEIRDKLDGSLGIQYYDGDNVCIATRRFFDKRQSIWANQWMDQQGFKRNLFIEGYTYLYEIIYPDNRVVIDYEERAELVLLAVINTEDGTELDIDKEGVRLGFETPQIINQDVGALESRAKDLLITHEGFVLRYPNGLRVKMKGDEYVRMHALINHCSTTQIWVMLKNGGNYNLTISNLPDEFHPWIKTQITKLETNYKDLMAKSQAVADQVEDYLTRRDQAKFILQEHKNISGIIFQLLDNKDPAESIWKHIKPEYEQPTW